MFVKCKAHMNKIVNESIKMGIENATSSLGKRNEFNSWWFIKFWANRNLFLSWVVIDSNSRCCYWNENSNVSRHFALIYSQTCQWNLRLTWISAKFTHQLTVGCSAGNSRFFDFPLDNRYDPRWLIDERTALHLPLLSLIDRQSPIFDRFRAWFSFNPPWRK